jgi:hypothetical protein
MSRLVLRLGVETPQEVNISLKITWRRIEQLWRNSKEVKAVTDKSNHYPRISLQELWKTRKFREYL